MSSMDRITRSEPRSRSSIGSRASEGDRQSIPLGAETQGDGQPPLAQGSEHQADSPPTAGGNDGRGSYLGPVALLVIVLLGVMVTFCTRYMLRRRRRRQNERATAADFDLRSWTLSESSVVPPSDALDRRQSRPLRESQLQRQPHDEGNFESLRGSFGSRVLATLCVPDDDIGLNRVCPICLGGLKRKVRRAPCGHDYHLNCVKSWVAKVSAWHCPLCVADSRVTLPVEPETSPVGSSSA